MCNINTHEHNLRLNTRLTGEKRAGNRSGETFQLTQNFAKKQRVFKFFYKALGNSFIKSKIHVDIYLPFCQSNQFG